MYAAISGISAPLINIVLIVAFAGGVFSLMEQFQRFATYQAERNEQKRELQAEFAAFLQEREKAQPATATSIPTPLNTK